jgi:hypothetical protein
MSGGVDRRKAGQVISEYVMVLGVLLFLTGFAALLLWVFKAEGRRILDLVSLSFP